MCYLFHDVAVQSKVSLVYKFIHSANNCTFLHQKGVWRHTNPNMMRRISTTSHMTLDNTAAKASWLSKASFWYRTRPYLSIHIIFWQIFPFRYTIPIFKIGLKRDFSEYDLTRPLPEHESAKLGKRLSKQWSKRMSNRKNAKVRPSLVGVIAHCFGWEIAAYGLALGLMELGCRIYQPIFVGLVLRYLSIINIDNNTTYVNIYRRFILLFSNILKTFIGIHMATLIWDVWHITTATIKNEFPPTNPCFTRLG